MKSFNVNSMISGTKEMFKKLKALSLNIDNGNFIISHCIEYRAL